MFYCKSYTAIKWFANKIIKILHASYAVYKIVQYKIGKRYSIENGDKENDYLVLQHSIKLTLLYDPRYKSVPIFPLSHSGYPFTF